MRLQELFLVETTEEDRAIISLSSAISQYLKKYEEEDFDKEYSDDEYDLDDEPEDDSDETIFVGRIGELFDTPLEILEPITIELQSDYAIRQRMKKEDGADVIRSPDKGSINGLWYGHNATMVVNKDLLGTNALQSTISHELRHALDDFKSDFEANKAGGRYSKAKNKAHRKVTKDPHVGNLAYLGQPSEINSRYLQAMNAMVPSIKRAAKLAPEMVQPSIMRDLKRAFEAFRITDLFPEKEKSRDYKRLIKRAMDFIDKELKHVQSTQPK